MGDLDPHLILGSLGPQVKILNSITIGASSFAWLTEVTD